MKPENPYQYKREELPFVTNEKIALCQGWQEGFDACLEWFRDRYKEEFNEIMKELEK